jgi:carboxymethylenebutenolidase
MKRREFIAATSALLGGSLTTARAADDRTRQLREVRQGALRLLVAEPGKRARGGVLIHPAASGVNAFTIRVAHELAALGYAAVIWDPYDGDDVPKEELAQVALSKRLQDEPVIGKLRQATDYLVGPLSIRRVTTIGWCMGGRYALMHAGHDDRVAAVAAYNPTIYPAAGQPLNGAIASKSAMPGQTLVEREVVPRIGCPVHVFRPGSDYTGPDQYAQLQSSLYSRQVPTFISYFPLANHGFAYRPVDDANRKAAEIAWIATLALFDEATKA